jgi:hypothetical protein
MHQRSDPKWALILNKVRIGQVQSYVNEILDGHSIYDVLMNKQLSCLKARGDPSLEQFEQAPVIVGTRAIRDAINDIKICEFARITEQNVHVYYSKDTRSKVKLIGEEWAWAWHINSSTSKDSLGQLPLVPGMKVMITENMAISHSGCIVNGAKGTLKGIKYEVDEDQN